MSISAPYTLRLTGMRDIPTEYDFQLDNAYFEAVADKDIVGGEVAVHIDIALYDEGATLSIHLKGGILTTCNRCLAPMTIAIEADEQLKVVFGEEYDDDGERVTIDERCGTLDMTNLLYEFVAIQIPIQHTHPEGGCDEKMIGILDGLMVTQAGDEVE